jgi:hypothetical protein
MQCAQGQCILDQPVGTRMLAAAPARASEASEDGGLWHHLLSTREPPTVIRELQPACRVRPRPRPHSHRSLAAEMTSPSSARNRDSVVPRGNTCNAGGCCSADYPVACGGYCCTPGSVVRSGNCTSPCPDDAPVACGDPLVCCAAGSVCGRDCNVHTTSTTIPGGGNCNCYCPDGSDCTGGKSCGVDENGIPNACGVPSELPLSLDDD